MVYCIPYTKTIKYLEIEINETLNFNYFCIQRFKKVQKSFIKLGSIGMKYTNGVHLQLNVPIERALCN